MRISAQKLVAYLSNKLHLNLNYFLKGGVWLFIPILVSYLLGLLRSVAFARLTGQEVYGQYNYILSVIGLVTILSLPGINTALIETVARGNLGSLADAARIRFRWGLLATLAITGVALYYVLLERERNLSIAFMLAGMLMPFKFAFGTVQSYYSGRKRFDIVSGLMTIILVLKTVLLLLLLWLQKGLVWLIIANSVTEILFYWLYYQAAVRHIGDDSRDLDMMSYGRSLTLAGAIGTVGAQLDSVILGFSVGFVDLAIYKIATVLPNSIKGLMKITSTLSTPKIAERPNKHIYSKRTQKHLLYLLIFNLLVMLLAIIALPIIMLFLYGDQYADSIRFAQFLLLSLIFGWPAAFFDASLRARKQTKAIYRANIIFGVLSIGTMVITVPFWGIWGVVSSRIAARWGKTFYQWRIVRTL